MKPMGNIAPQPDGYHAADRKQGFPGSEWMKARASAVFANVRGGHANAPRRRRRATRARGAGGPGSCGSAPPLPPAPADGSKGPMTEPEKTVRLTSLSHGAG